MNKSELIQRYARTGALARVAELKAEIAEIESAFPDLAGAGRPGRLRVAVNTADVAAPVTKRRTRKPMTAAQKKAVGIRMKKYWAARRKAKSE